MKQVYKLCKIKQKEIVAPKNTIFYNGSYLSLIRMSKFEVSYK